jgi:hypothetical protein
MNSERLAAEGFSAATILFAEPHDFSRLTEGMAAVVVRLPPRSVRKLGIRVLKPMTDERVAPHLIVVTLPLPLLVAVSAWVDILGAWMRPKGAGGP